MTSDDLISDSFNLDQLKKVLLERKLEETRKKKVQTEFFTGIKCSWCKNDVASLVYYKCKYHDNIFCEKCIKQRGDFKTKEFVKCKEQSKDYKNCIFERMEYK